MGTTGQAHQTEQPPLKGDAETRASTAITQGQARPHRRGRGPGGRTANGGLAEQHGLAPPPADLAVAGRPSGGIGGLRGGPDELLSAVQ